MADKRKTDPDPDDELGPSDLGPPADAEKTDDGYVYPESGSFVVEAHKGDTAATVTGPPTDTPETRRKAREAPSGRRRT
jgi:hypothetical protein